VWESGSGNGNGGEVRQPMATDAYIGLRLATRLERSRESSKVNSDCSIH